MTAQATHTVAVRSVLGTTERGGAVFSGDTGDGTLLKVVADHRALHRIPAKGEIWAVRGSVVHHPNYGRQLVASQCSYEVPRGRLIVRFLADNPAFTGIGEGKAAALWDAFGEELSQVLGDKDVDSLRTVLSSAMAERLAAVWAEHLAEATVVEYLDRHGFDLRLANKLRRVWGDRTLEMLDVNPYPSTNERRIKNAAM